MRQKHPHPRGTTFESATRAVWQERLKEKLGDVKLRSAPPDVRPLVKSVPEVARLD